MRRVMLTAAAALLVGAASAGAGDRSVRVLSDFDRPGRWRISQWSKAKGRIAIRPETAPKLANVKERKKSLGVKIAFPGGEGFRHFTLIPAAPIEPQQPRSSAVPPAGRSRPRPETPGPMEPQPQT